VESGGCCDLHRNLHYVILIIENKGRLTSFVPKAIIRMV
jgi:hypothetical protein